MSTRQPRGSAGASGSSDRLPIGIGSENQNDDPWPSTLVTPIVPPISSMRLFEIARPSPVPPYSRVVDVSACENF